MRFLGGGCGVFSDVERVCLDIWLGEGWDVARVDLVKDLIENQLVGGVSSGCGGWWVSGCNRNLDCEWVFGLVVVGSG